MASGRTVLISGASSGIGLATSLELARRGWRVWAGVRRPEAHDEVSRAVSAAGIAPDTVVTVDLDVTFPDQIFAAVERLVKAEGAAPSAVVANAGLGAVGFVEELDVDVWRKVIDTDLLGAVHTVRAALGPMRRAGRGTVVLVSSNAANLPHPAFSPYASAKWALEGFAEALALEVAPFGIAVTVVQPGAVRTGLGDRLIHSIPPDSAYGAVMERVAVGFARLERQSREVSSVAELIARIVELPRPPLRVRIGADARLAAVGRHLLPGRIRLELARRFYTIQRWREITPNSPSPESEPRRYRSFRRNR